MIRTTQKLKTTSFNKLLSKNLLANRLFLNKGYFRINKCEESQNNQKNIYKGQVNNQINRENWFATGHLFCAGQQNQQNPNIPGNQGDGQGNEESPDDNDDDNNDDKQNKDKSKNANAESGIVSLGEENKSESNESKPMPSRNNPKCQAKTTVST